MHPRYSLLMITTLLAGLALFAPGVTAASPASDQIPAATVASYAPGSVLEGIAFDQQGNRYVTVATSGQLLKTTPDGVETVLTTFPLKPGGPESLQNFLGTVVVDRDDVAYVTLIDQGDATMHGVWRVTPDGVRTRVAALPLGSQPNGITIDNQHNLFIADSLLGRVWRIANGSSTAQVWLENDLLRPVPGTGFPGANGLKFFHSDLYVAVSSAGTIVRVPVGGDGSAGAPSVYATGVPTDDFAFDVQGNIYATTHPFNTVVRIGRDGSQTVIATPAQEVVGPAAAAFGVRGNDRLNLYVVTDGGFFSSLIDPSSPVGPARVVRLEIGIPGAPIP